MPGGYEYFILRTVRQLRCVCINIVAMVDCGSSNVDWRMLYHDLYESSLRGITIGVVALAYHGWGFDAEGDRSLVMEMLTFLRESTDVTRRVLLQRFQKLDGASRDRILNTLETEGLVRLDKTKVEAVGLAEFVEGIPARCGLPELKLRTTAPDVIMLGQGSHEDDSRDLATFVKESMERGLSLWDDEIDGAI